MTTLCTVPARCGRVCGGRVRIGFFRHCQPQKEDIARRETIRANAPEPWLACRASMLVWPCYALGATPARYPMLPWRHRRPSLTFACLWTWLESKAAPIRWSGARDRQKTASGWPKGSSCSPAFSVLADCPCAVLDYAFRWNCEIASSGAAFGTRRNCRERQHDLGEGNLPHHLIAAAHRFSC